MALAEGILAFHLVVILFNVFGLVAIPLGGWLEWRFVRVRWWRVLHLATLGIVALQAVFDQPCFLTIWQDELSGQSPGAPLIMGWVDRLIYWPLPMWFFVLLYLAVFGYTVALWWLVPVRDAEPLQPSG
ncbi:MAG: DUF2784 domain-containing protein [Stellaceae bacterium]